MLCKTEGIVLRTFKHDEANLIARVYTQTHGAQSFLLKGFRSARGSRKFSYFQPLSIVELAYLRREQRDLHKLDECRPAVMLHEIQTQPIKLSLGLTMAEIFYDCVREEEPNEELYFFLRENITQLDISEKNHIQLFIWFMLHLTRFLGFFPTDASNGSRYAQFDFRVGRFTATEQLSDIAGVQLRQFLYADSTSCKGIQFDAQDKRMLLNTLFEYYRQHISGFKHPQTIRVFAEVFS